MAGAARTTITAVARHAGVSAATVSRVMNGSATVDAGIADRVRASARELNYSANPLARSLVLGRTQTIAYLAPDLSNPTFASTLRGLGRAAAADGHRLLVAESAEDAAHEPDLARELRRRCDGLVLAAPRMRDADLRAVCDELAPVVLVNRKAPRAGTPVLITDHSAGIRALARHLLDLGHRRLVFLAGSPSASDTRRRRGLESFVRAHPEVELSTVTCGVTIDDGHAAVDRVLASGATAVLAYNDLVALGVVSGLSERGVDVPGDVSVTGFDDIPFARHTSPALTTASVPGGELGASAWERLHAALRGEAPPGDLTFTPELVVRASTGPAPT